jgi:hypothetical protein
MGRELTDTAVRRRARCAGDAGHAPTKKPNLFVIGAMKCGTTSLHCHLDSHPAIFMSRIKEPGYFVRELNWTRGESWYRGLFAGAGEAAFVGESSTHYTKLPTHQGVAGRIAGFSPEARFIYIMRDPVDRCVSHYWHQVRSKSRQGGERRDMPEAFRGDGRYLAYSNYAMQLRPYFDRFGRDRVLTLTLEELSADGAGVMRRIYRWLGISPDVNPPSCATPLHATPDSIYRPVRWLARFQHSAAWGAVRPAFPAFLRRLGARVARGRPVDRAWAGTGPAVEFIRPICREYVAELTELLGRPFPEWTTTCAS